MDKMFQATTVVTVLLLCLGIFYSPVQAHHKFFSYPLNSIGIMTPFILVSSGAFFFQVCQMHDWSFRGGLITLELLQREETGSSWLWDIIVCLSLWALRQLHSLPSLLCRQPLSDQSKSCPAAWSQGRPPSLSGIWGVCHRSGPSLTLLLIQVGSSQGRKQLELGDVLRGIHPSLIQSLCLPSIVGITPDSVCPVFSHHYSVHLRLSTHHPKLYPYPSSGLTHQDNPTKTRWCMVGGCNPSTLHASILSNPISSFGRLLHP